VEVSASSVGRIWRARDLKPHRVRTFKLSNDPQFAEKTDEVVKLYLNPPPDSIVWSVDEQSQLQALRRTQPGLPCAAGHCRTRRTITSVMGPPLCSVGCACIAVRSCECFSRNTVTKSDPFLVPD